MNEIDALGSLGLTGTEARLYATLVRFGRLSGYEAARRAAVARPNAYPALDRLVTKGAVKVVHEDTFARYQAIAVSELARRMEHRLAAAARQLEGLRGPAAGGAKAAVGHGRVAMVEEAVALLGRARRSMHLALVPGLLDDLAPALGQVKGERLSIKAACLADCQTPCAVCGAEVGRLKAPSDGRAAVICADRQEIMAIEAEGAEVTFVTLYSPVLGALVAASVEGAVRLARDP